jgi:glycosyltransferase involved in cell wall biosynthesis
MHSIIIPHKNRNANLELCLNSIRVSADACGRFDYEVIIVDAGSDVTPDCSSKNERLVLFADTPPVTLYPGETAPFWKPSILNVGMDAAKGDILTFLDADAVVGRRFMDGVKLLDDHALTRLCYRVRYIDARDIATYASRSMFDFLTHPIAYEAYGAPDTPGIGGTPVFGNSQFSIRRDSLGDLRWDENYIGRGFEDLSFIRDIWRRHGNSYVGKMVTEPDEAMYHITHDYSPGFGCDRWNNRNRRIYHEIPCLWFVSDSEDMLARCAKSIGKIASHKHEVRYVHQSPAGGIDGPWRSEVIDWLDDIVSVNERTLYWQYCGVKLSPESWMRMLSDVGIYAPFCQLGNSASVWASPSPQPSE